MNLKLKHRLTAYHLRYDRGKKNKLAICTCGWHCRMFRPKFTTRVRRMICTFRGHQFGELKTWEVGRVGFEDGKGEYGGSYRQCDFCYFSEDID